ncbi:MAG: bile acid:sodium symporter family protein [Acidobacteria bacterium]|nr:bile acid:sodium symporter family protein [Acidobacteriota bacterium]
MFRLLTEAFPFWVLACSALALARPTLFTWFSGPLITLGLGVIMLSMGMTLGFEDFRRVGRQRSPVLAGVFLQYTIMPILGWSIGYLLALPTPFAVGLVLVSCCPGGTASNVITYLAKADVALSVTMTAVSTLLAAVMTPTLTALLAGSRIEVSAAGLFMDTVQVVILPVVAGAVLKWRFPRAIEPVLPVAPLVAVVTITLIVASVIGAGREQILESGFRLLLAVFGLHLFGFLFGYLGGKALLGRETAARTISIEVGMQNSGLGVVLARGNFANPLVAIPSAISTVAHSLIGSLVAAWWSRSPADGAPDDADQPRPRP